LVGAGDGTRLDVRAFDFVFLDTGVKKFIAFLLVGILTHAHMLDVAWPVLEYGAFFCLLATKCTDGARARHSAIDFNDRPKRRPFFRNDPDHSAFLRVAHAGLVDSEALAAGNRSAPFCAARQAARREETQRNDSGEDGKEAAAGG
jgi:hypothetical protein